MFRKLSIVGSFLVFSTVSEAQQHLDYQLRLEPVWSRVADALGEPGSVESAEFSKDGKYIVSCTKYDNSIIMWRTSDGTELWRRYAAKEVERVGWSADGNYVAACSEDSLVRVYNARNGEIKTTLKHANGIDGLTWSNSGNLLATGEEVTAMSDGSIMGWLRIFDMNTGKQIKSINYGSTVNELFFSQDDRFLLAVGHSGAKIYRTADWSLLQTLRPGNAMLISGVFSPDARYVLATGHSGSSRGNLYLWDWREGKLLRELNHTGRKIESVSWHPDGNYIVHAGHDPYIYIYRVADILKFSNDAIPVAQKTWAGDHAEKVHFNKNGSFLVSAHQNGLIKLWVWMGENSGLNSQRHDWVREQQKK
jgi:WD40 repeat protein